MKRTIAVDVDGILADFVEGAMHWANTYARPAGGASYTREQITEFDILKSWGIGHLWGELDRFVCKPGFCEGLNPLPGAREFLAALGESADVVIVTSPWKSSPTWCYERRNWLEKLMGWTGEVIFTKRKDLIRADALVDDAADHTDNFPGVGVLLDSPWNQHATRSLRVDSLPQAIDRLATIGLI